MAIKIKRIYDPPDAQDGYRVLVDRLWPRGVSKEKAAIDFWFKKTAPTNELRKWFAHDPKKWQEFIKRYTDEIDAGALSELRQMILGRDNVTLLYAARDEEHNEAIVLKHLLEKNAGG